jgi:hypothetical protein
MRARTLLPLALVLVPALALADGEPLKQSLTDTNGMSNPVAGTKPCDAVLAFQDGPTGKCKKVTSKKVKGVGTATVYAVSEKDAGWTRYALVIDDGTGLHVSQPFDFQDDCAMMKCDTVKKLKPKLRAVSVGGVATAELEIDAQMVFEMTDPEDGKTMSKIPYHRHVFAACGKNGSGAWRCASADLGTHDAPCTASLDTTGILRYACEDMTELSLGQ